MENIGKRIRELRKKNDLTQEKLANYLNVSFQTVSKWEIGVNTPDLSFIVPLAKLLHTTTDVLLGYVPLPEESDSRRKELEDAWKAERYGLQEGEKMIAAAQALVNAYPDNPVYWCWLAYGERLRAFEQLQNDMNFEKYKTMLKQSLGHYEMVIEDCKEEYWREEALESAVYILCTLNRQAEALVYAEQLTTDVRRDRVYRECLPKEERIRHIQDMRYKAMHRFLNELLELAGTYLWASEMMIDILHNMISDGNYLSYHNYLNMAYEQCSRHYIMAERYDDAMAALRKAWIHAQEYDNFNAVKGEHPFTAPLMDRLTAKSWPSMHSSVKTFMTTFQAKWFDPLRDREDFRQLEAECRAACPDTDKDEE